MFGLMNYLKGWKKISEEHVPLWALNYFERHETGKSVVAKGKHYLYKFEMTGIHIAQQGSWGYEGTYWKKLRKRWQQ